MTFHISRACLDFIGVGRHESRPESEMSRTCKQTQTHNQKAGQLLGLQSFPQCHPGPSAGLWQTIIHMGAVSSPVGAGSNMEPSKTADRLCHLLRQQAHEAIGWHCENLPFAPSCGMSCLLTVNCYNFSVPPLPTYSIICSRIAPFFHRPKGPCTLVYTLKAAVARILSHACCGSHTCSQSGDEEEVHGTPHYPKVSWAATHQASQGGLWVSEIEVFCPSWFPRYLQGKPHHLLHTGRCHVKVLGGKTTKHIRVTDRQINLNVFPLSLPILMLLIYFKVGLSSISA